MGWTSSESWRSRKDVTDELTADFARSGYKVVAAAPAKGAWYAALEKDGTRFAVVVLIERHHRGYSYKDMSENMHPYFYAVPPKVWRELDGHPRPASIEGADSDAWREGVRAAIARKAAAS